MRHERIVEEVRKPDSSKGRRGYYIRYRVRCACGKFEDEVRSRRVATFAYREHIDAAMAKPSPFEPELGHWR